MPTLISINETDVNAVDSNARPPPIDLNQFEHERYISECPKEFGPDNLSPLWLRKNLIETQEVLLYYSLDELNNLYFNDSKIEALSKLCHTNDTKVDANKKIIPNITIKNCSVFVTVGMKEAYETEFQRTKSTKSPSVAESICLKTRGTTRGSKLNYEEVFVDFFSRMFSNPDATKIERTYGKENMFTICIFARSRHSTKTKKIRYTDQLIGAASFVMDKHDSVLISWLGVLQTTLADLEIHDSLKKNTKSLRTNHNIGTFLLILCQVIKSTMQKKWCPIVCQVHGTVEDGPLGFYRNNFFIQCSEMNQIVFSQLINRKDSVIYDDPNLVWMLLLFPLNDLLMTIIDMKTDWKSYNLILIRGYIYFLDRNRQSLQQDKIEKYLENIVGSDGNLFNKDMSIHVEKSIIDDNEAYEKLHDEQVQSKPTILSAGIGVLDNFLNLINEKSQSQLSLLDTGNGVDESDCNSMFIAISKVLYGSSHYFMNLRLFIAFYYRSVSKLSRKHPFYNDDDIVSGMVNEAGQRVWGDILPPQFIDENGVIKPAWYRRIFYRLSQSLMCTDAPAEFNDLCVFASMLGVEFIIVDGRSYQITVPDDIQDREWKISFKRTYGGNDFINKSLTEIHQRPKHWLACIFESHFMPIIQNPDDHQVDDITFMIPSVGLVSPNNDESNLIQLSQSQSTSMLLHDSLDERLHQLLIKEPFQQVRNIQKAYNIYSDSTTISKFIKKNTKVPGTSQKFGNLMTCQEFVEAGIPDEYILACLRCLDPPAVLVEYEIWPIANQCQFIDLMHLRKNTWLNETCTKLFIDYLSSKTDRYYFLDPATFNNTITQAESLMNLIQTRGWEDHEEKDIMILFHIKDHFIVVEIRRSFVWEEKKN